MWIITNRGFFSVVAKGPDGKPSEPGSEALVSVRFRRRKDAKALFPKAEYVATPHGDYAGRVFVTRAEVAEMLAREALGLDYTNFKSSIPATDAPLHDAAMAAWHVFGKLQPGGPYGTYARPLSATRDLFGAGYPGSGYTGVGSTGFPKPGKKAGRDPFCDGCGMRFGARALDENHLCADCAADLVDPWRDAEVLDEAAVPDLVLADLSATAGDCWSCGASGTALDRDGLCDHCGETFSEFTREELAEIRGSCD